MLKETDIINLNLTVKEVNIMLQGLQSQPFKDVFAIINSIEKQAITEKERLYPKQEKEEIKK